MKNILTAVIIFVAVFTLNACKKNDVNPNGTLAVRVVNAAPGSGAQGFTLANQILISGGLNFTDASGFINTNSGNRLVAQFTSSDNSVTASSELFSYNGLSVTVYLVGGPSSRKVKYFGDFISAPPAGQVRVRFLHLSDGAASSLKIQDSNGNSIVNSLNRYENSDYKNVSSGTLNLQIIDHSTNTLIKNLQVPNIEAGKNYAIYFTGASNNELDIHSISY